MTTQLSLPVEVRPDEIARKQSLGASIELCAELGGFELDKALTADMKFDKAQFSRWTSGQEGITWPKLEKLMDRCGNDAPVLWMAHQRNYDLYSMRRRESETERENRLLREENAALRRVLAGQA